MTSIVVNLVPAWTRSDRKSLIRRIAVLLLPMAAIPVLEFWYLNTMPSDSQDWLMGGSAAMMMFLVVTVGASTLIGKWRSCQC